MVVLQDRYPWLEDPQLDILNVSEEMNKLQVLRDTKSKLLEEMHKYKGLKPDIGLASQQLVDIKRELKSLNENYFQ